jgi:hypothetical protein
MSALDMEYAKALDARRHKLATLDGLGTVAVLMLLFVGLMFL